MDPDLENLLQLGEQTQGCRIAIMGGTFDPIHYGHLVAAEVARVEFKLAKVIFVPNRQPPHKKNYRVTPADHRYQMTVLATITNPHFYVSQIELNRPGPSYTIDTLRELKKTLDVKAELFFISGADAILDILNWKEADEVMENCSFIAATRPGYPLNELNKCLGHLQAKFSHKVSCVEIPALAISSSSVRKRVAQNRPIKYLIPESVENYIYKHGLYQKSRRDAGDLADE